jgi:hypothetical protein
MSILSTITTAANPFKEYLIAGAAVALGIGVLLYNHHERAIGAAQTIAADQKTVAAQVERDQAVQTIATVATQLAEKNYENAIAVPVTNAPVPVRLCRLALSSGPLPSAAGPGPSGVSTPVVGSPDASSVAELQRFADAAVAIARDADKQVVALQAANAALRAEMLNANAKK